MNLDPYLASIHDGAARMASCADRAEHDRDLLGLPVAACPGWDVRHLFVHTGWIHRWATQALRTGSPPSRDDVHEPHPTIGGEELGAWLRLGAGVLADVLAAQDPGSDTWHPFPFEQKAWVWSRRQAHETTIHRWDAESAVLGASDLDGVVSCDGLREFFEMMLPRAIVRENHTVPSGSVRIHCTDGGELASGAVCPDDARLQTSWTIWNDAGEYRMCGRHGDEDDDTASTADRDASSAPPGAPDAEITGEAAALFLALMGRADRESLTIGGDDAVAAAWMDLPGP